MIAWIRAWGQYHLERFKTLQLYVWKQISISLGKSKVWGMGGWYNVCLLYTSNTKEEMDFVVESIKRIVERLRSMSPLYEDYMKKHGEAQ